MKKFLTVGLTTAAIFLFISGCVSKVPQIVREPLKSLYIGMSEYDFLVGHYCLNYKMTGEDWSQADTYERAEGGTEYQLKKVVVHTKGYHCYTSDTSLEYIWLLFGNSKSEPNRLKLRAIHRY